MNNTARIKCYRPFAVSQVKIAFAYRMAFFVRLLSNFFTVMITYYLWRAIYQSGTEAVMGGFTFEEMTAYVVISFFTTSMLSAVQANNIAYAIQDGSIAISLIRPLSFQGIQMAESMGNFIVNALIFSFPFMLIFTLRGWLIPVTPGNLLLFIISVVLSFFIQFYFNFCFSMLAFYTTYFFGLDMAKTVIIKLCSGALIPLSFFPASVEKIFTLLPFSSMNYIPVMIYLGKLQGSALVETIGLQVFWVVILYLLCRIFWKAAIRRLTVLGG